MPAKKEKNKLVVILGPTSAGKTSLAVKLAKEFNGEIISADSRQVYKGMDIGTGKDLAEYGTVPYHLIDVISPKKQFSVALFQKLAYKAIDKVIKKGKTPFLTGGSGLYLQAVIDGYVLNKAKPNKHLRKYLDSLTLKQLQLTAKKFNLKFNESDRQNKRRLVRQIEICQKNLPEPKKQPRYDCLILGLNLTREKLNKKIEQRLGHRLKKEGLIDEVKKIHASGISWKKLDSFGLEYRFVSKYLQGELNYNEMETQLATAIKQFAKRQITWFSAMSRSASGKKPNRIRWVKSPAEAKKLIKQFYLVK